MNKIYNVRKYIESKLEESKLSDKIDIAQHQEVLMEIDRMLLNYMIKSSGIENLDLSARQYCCLKRAGIDSIEQLSNLCIEDLYKIRNLSTKEIDDLIKKGYVKS